jgi:signal peptidase I
MAVPSFYRVDKRKRKLQETLRFVVNFTAAVTFAVMIGFYFVSPITVTGRSMESVLSDGNVVFVNRLTYLFQEPERLQLVYFKSQSGNGEERTLIRRVIGLPGETIQMKDGQLYVNGSPLALRDQLDKAVLSGLASEPVILGENEYFVLGDNRDNSEDSRFESVGNVRRADLIGKVWFKLEPLDEMGFVK